MLRKTKEIFVVRLEEEYKKGIEVAEDKIKEIEDLINKDTKNDWVKSEKSEAIFCEGNNNYTNEVEKFIRVVTFSRVLKGDK